MVSSVSFTSCGGGGGGGGGEAGTDAAPSTLDGLELFFVDGVGVASFQFAKVSGDAATEGEIGFSNSIDGGGDGATTTIKNEFGGEETYDLFERMSNITYTYNKTGPNTGQIKINSQTFSNDTGNVDIFAVSAASGSDVDFTMNIVFGSLGAVIGEIVIDFIDVPVEAADPLRSYTLTSNNSTVKIQIQGGGAVPLGYDEDDSSRVNKLTSPTLYPEKFSTVAIPLIVTFDNGDEYKTLGVSSDDQGFGSDALDQGVVNLQRTESGDVTDLGTVAYGWFGNEVTGSDTIAELRLVLPTRTEVYQFEFTSIEEGTFRRISPDDGETGSFNFPNADN